MKPATQYFIKAIIWEFVLTLIVVSTLSALFDYYFSLEPFQVFVALLMGLIPLIPLAYRLGEKIDYTKKSVSERTFLGLVFQFVFLTILFLFPILSICVFTGEVAYFFEICLLTAGFYLFSCFHTFVIGSWLGKKLSEIE